MKNQQYKATLSKDNNRGSWCVIFRHPLKQDENGKPGRRVRRGLGTSEKKTAQTLVDQLNELLGDETMWNPMMRDKAANCFEDIVVRAFYEDLSPATQDLWAIRNEIIPLPGKEDKYSRALLLGTTGAGKTTLLRQLIGTNPKTERFPSTSTAKTTVCDTEIILCDGLFRAAVTFFSRDMIRLCVEECATAAAVAKACFNAERKEVVRRFMEHSEQRFRLSYILGTLKSDETLEDEEDEQSETSSEVNDEERKQLLVKLTSYLDRVESVAEEAAKELENELEWSRKGADEKSSDAFQEIFEDKLRRDDNFQELLDDLMDDIESRFEFLEVGKLNKDRTGWPTSWVFETSDRALLIKTMNRFASNYAPNFGRLLTPLVEGVRVAGPFQPDWLGRRPKLVLMDGEGLGHTPDSASSISTKVTKRFEIADAIVLVDSAKQPMQAAPCALLRSLASSGHESKLVVSFTHFDQVKGDNLAGVGERQAHVLGSVENSLQALEKTLGINAANALKRRLSDRIFFLSSIQAQISEKAKLTRSELGKVVEKMESLIIPPPPATVTPIYDLNDVWLRLQRATSEFRNPWRARLRLPSPSPTAPEHWKRIEALSRRFAQFGQDHYCELMPVADLINSMSVEFSKLLSDPTSWQPSHAPEEMKISVIDGIKQEFSKRLHAYAQENVFFTQLKLWASAYGHSGQGSARLRSRDIETIYGFAAPVPSEADETAIHPFMNRIRLMIEEAIQAGGGKIS